MITSDSSGWTVDRPPTDHGGQGNLLSWHTQEPPSGLPTPNSVNERLDSASGLSASVLVRLTKLDEENRVEMRLIPGVVPINNPEPNNVPQRIVSGGNLSKPIPEPPSLTWLLWLGATSLAVGVVTLGLGLLTTS
jgi:hypothetical protein